MDQSLIKSAKIPRYRYILPCFQNFSYTINRAIGIGERKYNVGNRTIKYKKEEKKRKR